MCDVMTDSGEKWKNDEKGDSKRDDDNDDVKNLKPEYLLFQLKKKRARLASDQTKYYIYIFYSL